jgi:RNA polymerase sigma factor (TIGR02999 family)
LYEQGIFFLSMNLDQNDITLLLNGLKDNDTRVIDKIYPLVYDHLRNEAHLQLRRERAGHTLQTTALVNEAYLKLVDQEKSKYQNRSHFLAIAAMAMRRILISYARKKNAEKRGGNEPAITFTDGMAPYEARLSEMVDLDDALEKLVELDERQAKIVQYRFFGGMNYKEIADVMGGTEHSVRYDWRVARAWLKRELGNR